jgi:hypothetical protein
VTLKPLLTLTLTASLIASSLPARAQPRYAYSPNVSDWSFVAAIAPGTKVAVSAVGLGGQDSQYFVSATNRELTLLTLANADLPTSARKFVIKLAGTHPDIFMTPQRWIEYRDGSARVTPDGVFVRGRKVADLSDISKTIDAGDVAEVAKRVKTPRQRHPFEASPAEGVAALVPFLGLSLLGCNGQCGRAALAVAAIGGPIIAAEVIAARKATYTNEIVYRVR